MKIPEGFLYKDFGSSLVLVREDLKDSLTPFLTQPLSDFELKSKSLHWHFGRGPVPVVSLDSGHKAVLRTYRHGGLLRGLTRDVFLGLLPRPFRELALSKAAIDKGVKTPPVLGASVFPVIGPIYRGLLATEELPEARDGLSILSQAAELRWKQRRQLLRVLLREAGKTIARAHNVGLIHTDLNVKNLVVTAEPISVFILDLDRGRLERGSLNDGQRRAQLKRLNRSLQKVSRENRLTSLSKREALFFVDAYARETGKSARDILELFGGWC